MNRIKVRLYTDAMGNVTISPVSERVAKAVGKSNAYDGTHEVFIQEARAQEWIDVLPKAAFYGRGKNRDFNDGVVFLIDEWTFRHMVGGQSD